jgi:hypothetical protein
MRRSLGLSSPVYDIPMEDTDLIILGRIALIWGQILFHLDMILLSLMAKMSVEMLKEYPTRSLDRKLKDLSRELSNPKNATIRALLLPVHAAIDGLASDRNVISTDYGVTS